MISDAMPGASPEVAPVVDGRRVIAPRSPLGAAMPAVRREIRNEPENVPYIKDFAFSTRPKGRHLGFDFGFVSPGSAPGKARRGRAWVEAGSAGDGGLRRGLRPPRRRR